MFNVHIYRSAINSVYFDNTFTNCESRVKHPELRTAITDDREINAFANRIIAIVETWNHHVELLRDALPKLISAIF